jgi:hypothetical protein
MTKDVIEIHRHGRNVARRMGRNGLWIENLETLFTAKQVSALTSACARAPDAWP